MAQKSDPTITANIDTTLTNLSALLSTAAAGRRVALLDGLGLPADASTKSIVAAIRSTRRSFMGVEVNWSFGDGGGVAVKIPRNDVRDALDRARFAPGLVAPEEGRSVEGDPKPFTIVEAMRMTARLGFGRVQVDKLTAPNSDTPVAFGFKVQETGDGEKGDRWPMGARVRVDTASGEAVALPPEGDDTFAIDSCRVAAERFVDIANMMVTHATNRDLSQALLDAVCSVDGIGRIRNRGGSYLILDGEDLDRFVDLLDSLRDATVDEPLANRFVPDVEPKYSDPLSISMWQRRAVEDFATSIEGLLGDLRSANDPTQNMRPRTIEKRRDDVVGLVSRANRMKNMLAENLSEITTLLGGLKGDFDRALTAALAEVDAVDAALARSTPKKRVKRPQKRAKAAAKVTAAPKPAKRQAAADIPRAAVPVDVEEFEKLFRF